MKKKNFGKFILTFAVLLLLLAAACNNEDYVPKPRIYPKVTLPKGSMTTFEATFCEFTFKQPTYTTVEQDTSFFESKPLHPCWFDLVYPDLAGRVHFTYYPLTGDKNLNQLVNEAYRMGEEHIKKAKFIDEVQIHLPERRVYGLLMKIEGAVASPFQFYVTDSTQHFLRGALYFNARPNPDSLAPAIRFVEKDLEAVIQTLNWK